jgi:hypothetical protein
MIRVMKMCFEFAALLSLWIFAKKIVQIVQRICVHHVPGSSIFCLLYTLGCCLLLVITLADTGSEEKRTLELGKRE